MMPMYNTKLFTDIWTNADDFKKDYDDSPFSGMISDESVTLLYYLLYSRYGNNPIANFDEEQFKIKLFSVVFQYGPTWEKRLDIQEKLRNLSENELIVGSKSVTNHAFNPSTEPSTDTLEEIQTINDQTTNSWKRSKLEAYSNLMALLERDVTEEFLRKFRICFKLLVEPENPIIYETEN